MQLLYQFMDTDVSSNKILQLFQRGLTDNQCKSALLFPKSQPAYNEFTLMIGIQNTKIMANRGHCRNFGNWRYTWKMFIAIAFWIFILKQRKTFLAKLLFFIWKKQLVLFKKKVVDQSWATASESSISSWSTSFCVTRRNIL